MGWYGDDDNQMMVLVVTGPSDGIGREFAIYLAKAGFNLLLISRSEEKLKELAEECGRW